MTWKRVEPMEERCRFVLLASGPKANISELCREFGISRRIGYKWLRRFAQEGLHGLEDRSRRPLRCPHETSAEFVCEIVSIRQAHPRWGGVTIHEILRRRHSVQDIPSARTIDRILNRCGLVKARKRGRRRKYTPEQNLKLQQEIFDKWRNEFNTERPHRALKMSTLSECYSVSTRKYSKTIIPYDYGDKITTRKVGHRGSIWWRGKPRFISGALSREKIGIEILDDMILSLWFRDFQLGTTDIDFAHPLGSG